MDPFPTALAWDMAPMTFHGWLIERNVVVSEQSRQPFQGRLA